MKAKAAFRPPVENPLIESLTRACVPLLLKGMFHDLRVTFRPDDLRRLGELRGERMLLLPNHPSTEDPITMFELARQLGEPMHYVAAREVFDFDHGVRGWLFQRCGVYSVIRGAPDRESFRMTRQILTRGSRRLVIFVEGEISYRNDILIPFQQGVLQLALSAQEDVCEQFESAPPVYVAPVAIRYFYAPGVEAAMRQSVERLEEALGLETPDSEVSGSDAFGDSSAACGEASTGLFRRIVAIGERIVGMQEALMRLSGEGKTMNERVSQLKNKLLAKMEHYLELETPSGENPLDRVRAIRNRMDKVLYAYDDPDGLCAYEREGIQGRSRAFAEFYDDLDRVVNFMTYKEEDFTAKSPSERFVEMIYRLEKEVFGERRLSHPRTAAIQIGECEDLRARMPQWQASRKQAVADLCRSLEADMRALLQTAQPPG